MIEHAIEVSSLAKRFGSFPAVRGVDIAVPAGAFLVLVGPSGCGKSTILRLLAGLEEPSGGEIRINGRLVADGDRGILVKPGDRDAGLVFQSYALWPHMTVSSNVDWPLRVAGWESGKRRERVKDVLTLLDILELRDRYPGEISGGQQQRVAIARMIGPRPSVLLFDEPLSNLDAKLRVEMRAELLRIHQATGATSVYVTHDQVEALAMATHVAVLNEGLVEQFGSPRELWNTPASAFVATFVGTPPGNLVPVTKRDGSYCVGDVSLASASVDDSLAVCSFFYRAEELHVGDTAGPRRLLLEFAEASPIAGRYMVIGRQGALRLTAVVERSPALVLGEHFYLEFPERPAAVFDADGQRVDSGVVSGMSPIAVAVSEPLTQAP
jgi:iron(III) transport system ATP-binding protein